MKKILKASLAFVMASGLVSTTALIANAQEVTLSAEMLEFCENNGLNGASCACFLVSMVEQGVLENGEFTLTQEDVDMLVSEYSEDAEGCIAAN